MQQTVRVAAAQAESAWLDLATARITGPERGQTGTPCKRCPALT
jgi:hypothetical protein